MNSKWQQRDGPTVQKTLSYEPETLRIYAHQKENMQAAGKTIRMPGRSNHYCHDLRGKMKTPAL